MMRFFLSPPIAFLFFFLKLTLFYLWVQRFEADGTDHPDKHLPYSGGQKIPPVEVRLSYERFFRLGLLFGVAHVAVLVLATLTLAKGGLWLGLVYLLGISISVVALGHKKEG